MMYDIPTTANDVPGLEDYLRAARERWRLILFVLLVFIVAALAFNRARTPIYEGEARVIANPSIYDATGRVVLEREKEIIAGVTVANEAATRVADGMTGLAILDDLKVTFVNDSDTLEVVYPDPDPDRAVLVVNMLVDSYVDLREERSLSVYETQITTITAEIDILEAQMAEIDDELALQTVARTDALALPAENPTRQGTIDAIVERITLLNTSRNGLSGSLSVLGRELSVLERDLASRRVTAEVIQYATPPDGPSGPSNALILIAAALFGILAGVGLAFVLDRLDRTARESSDVEGALGTTVIGNIPKFSSGGRRFDVIMLSSAKNTRTQRVREAYRRTRASLQFLQTSMELKSFLITSARPGEGKSSTVANLGIAAAQAGSRVVIISADMRRPTQERLFGIEAHRGLSDYLVDPNISDIMVPVPGVEGLAIVPSGSAPNNPGELLGSNAFRGLIEHLSSQFDLVLIDTPPILSTADAGSAAPFCDGVLIVVDSQRTDTDSLLRVRTTMERSGSNVVGAILNKDTTDTGMSLRRDRYAYEKVAGQK